MYKNCYFDSKIFSGTTYLSLSVDESEYLSLFTRKRQGQLSYGGILSQLTNSFYFPLTAVMLIFINILTSTLSIFHSFPATYHLALLMVCTFHSSLDMHDAAHTMRISDIATSAWLIDFCHKAIEP